MLLRLRITLPDRPGSLAQVTRVLGVAGADITQLTVLDRGDGTAVDDLTVYWPESEPRETLTNSLRSVPGVEVEGVWATREAPATPRAYFARCSRTWSKVVRRVALAAEVDDEFIAGTYDVIILHAAKLCGSYRCGHAQDVVAELHEGAARTLRI